VSLPIESLPRPSAESSWSDPRLVQECVKGNQEAWTTLIDRYKNLIFSIPLKHGFAAEDAAEIFQWVCVSLLSELPRLRDPKALPAWLIRVTSNQCFHWRRQQKQFIGMEDDEMEAAPDPESQRPLENLIHEVEMEQSLREALNQLSPRCRQLISMLFFEMPAKPYEEIATSLGLARGSIGFTRSRCLEQLRKKLEGAGFTG
jgi:RNA polymerase sigma factor (sigma-70 family)